MTSKVRPNFLDSWNVHLGEVNKTKTKTKKQPYWDCHIVKKLSRHRRHEKMLLIVLFFSPLYMELHIKLYFRCWSLVLMGKFLRSETGCFFL